MRILPPLLLFLGLLLPVGLAAQVPDPSSSAGQFLSRAELERVLADYEAAMSSSAYSAELRAEAAREAQRVRERLEIGDFRAGDRIVLTVQGEEELPDTVPVGPGPSITLPLLGAIDLRGVLRSELNAHLTTEIGRVLRDPVVRAEGLLRVSVQGSVGAPGFYLMPADILVGEALMIAGGPSQGADLEKLRVERAGQVLFQGDPLQEALADGMTLDELNFRAGDQILLPQERESFFIAAGRYVLVVATTLFLGTRVF